MYELLLTYDADESCMRPMTQQAPPLIQAKSVVHESKGDRQSLGQPSFFNAPELCSVTDEVRGAHGPNSVPTLTRFSMAGLDAGPPLPVSGRGSVASGTPILLLR